MSARKLLYQGMVLGPVILLGFIGLGARAHKETCNFPQFTSRQDAVIDEYVTLMRCSEQLPESIRAHRDREAIRFIGDKWAQKELRGQLANIPSFRTDLSVGATIKEQVRSAQVDLIGMLMRLASLEELEHDYDQSAKDLATAAVITQINKTCDLTSIAQACRRQYMLYRQIHGIAQHLSPKTRAEVASRIASMRSKDMAAVTYLQEVASCSKIDRADYIGQDFTNQTSFRDRTYSKACLNLNLQVTARNNLIVAMNAKASHVPQSNTLRQATGHSSATALLVARTDLQEPL